MRRSSALALLLLVPAAACGGDDEDTAADQVEGSATSTERDAATATEAEAEAVEGGTVAPEAYATNVCGSIDRWYDRIEAATTDGLRDAETSGNTDSADTKARAVEFFEVAIDLTDEMIVDVEQAGVPDAEGGGETAADVVGGMEDVRALFVTARDDTEALPDDDPEALATGVQGVVASLQGSATAVGSNLEAVLASATDPDLVDAFERSCGITPAPEAATGS